MKHPEWLGNKKLIERLLRESGLYTEENESNNKVIMYWIIWGRYVEFMSVSEILSKLYVEYNLDVSFNKYYRLQNMAIKILENVEEK